MNPVRWVLLVAAIFVVGSGFIVAASQVPEQEMADVPAPPINLDLPDGASAAQAVVDLARERSRFQDPLLQPTDLEAGTQVLPPLVDRLLDLPEPPTEAALTALRTAADIEADYDLRQVSITVTALDPHPGRDRGWGTYLARAGGSGVHLQVPHPFTDLGTAVMGAELFGAGSAGLLSIAGAARTARDGLADAAHATDLPFHAVHLAALDRASHIVQVHGFAAERHPAITAELIVSAGLGDPSEVAGLAAVLTDAGFEVCVPDGTGACDALAGRTNIQGTAAFAAGVAFIHLEVADTVRLDDDRRARFVERTGAWLASLA